MTDRPDSELPDPLPSGYRFGRFVVERELSPGRTCRVYRALDTSLNRPVAVNVLSPAFRDDTGRHALFLCAEAAALKKGRRVYDVGEQDGILYVSVEYQEGEDAAIERWDD